MTCDTYTALPLAIMHGHFDIAERIIELDSHTSNLTNSHASNITHHASPVLSRVYANGITAACLAAGRGQPALLKRILGGGGCDLGVVCAAAGKGMFIDDRMPNISSSSSSSASAEAYAEVLEIAVAGAAISRVELGDVWNGRQAMWFACR